MGDRRGSCAGDRRQQPRVCSGVKIEPKRSSQFVAKVHLDPGLADLRRHDRQIVSDRYVVPKREAAMDDEAYRVTDDADGNKRRQHGQPLAIALARIHREWCLPAQSYQSAYSLLPSRLVRQIEKGIHWRIAANCL